MVRADRRLLRDVDWLLVALVTALALLGLVLVASATQARLGDRPSWLFVTKQATFMVAGLALAVVLAFSDPAVIQRAAPYLYVVNLALLLAVRLFGRETLGAQRWLQVGPADVQPSEFSKLILIVTLAALIARWERGVDGWLAFFKAGLYVLPPFGLVLIQPDLGTSLVYVAIFMGMAYAGGMAGWRVVAVGGLGLGTAIGWIVAHLRYGVPILLKEYQLRRLIVFTNPEVDPLGAGYHVLQSEIAIGSGGLTGRGLFSGSQNQLNYLPEQHTDFIFSVLGEELGFVGAALVICCYLAILWRAARAMAEARDRYCSLLAGGIISMLVFHVLVNVGMTMGVMPVAGVPLPFLSYGGSSLLTNSAAIGLLLNVGMRRRKILF